MNAGPIVKLFQTLGAALLGACRDLAPIVAVIAVFQILVLRQPLPELISVLGGLALVIVGLALFVIGLDAGLFPPGRNLGRRIRAQGQPVLAAAVRLRPGFRHDSG